MIADRNTIEALPETSIKEKTLRSLPWIATLAILPIILFRVGAGNFLAIGDNYLELHMAIASFFDQVRDGKFSMWAPALCAGIPVEYGNFSAFYPLYWLYAILPPAAAFNSVVYLTYFIAAVGVYLFMREWKASRGAAFFSAVAFAYGAFNMSWFHSLMAVEPAIWSGWFFLTLEKIRKARGVGAKSRNIALGGIVFWLISVAGHPQIALYISLAAGAYVLYSSIKDRSLAYAISAAMAVAIGASLAAPHLLTSSALASNSFRSSLGFEAFDSPEMSPLQFFGGLLSFNALPNANFEMCLGVLPFLLALIEIRAKQCHPLTPIALIIVASATILALGQSTGLNRLLYHIPIYNLFSFHSRHMVEIGFFTAIIAGIGLDRVLNKEAALIEKRSLLITGGAFLATILLLSFTPFKPDSRLLVAPVVAVAAIALIQLSISIEMPVKQKGALVGLASVLFLIEPYQYFLRPVHPMNDSKMAKSGGFVSQLVGNREGNKIAPARVFTMIHPMFADKSQLYEAGYGNLASMQGISSANGYHPSMLRRYKETMKVDIHGWPEDIIAFFEPRNRSLDLLAARYLVYDPSFYLRPHDEAGNPIPGIMFDGVEFGDYLNLEFKPGEKRTIVPAQRDCDEISVVTTLSEGARLTQGQEAGKITVEYDDGAREEFYLKAGENTAVFNHESLSGTPEVQETIESVPYYGLKSWYLRPGERADFKSPGLNTKSVGIISYLVQSDGVKNGEVVGKITLHNSQGDSRIVEMRAGANTADWAIEDGSRTFLHRSPSLHRRVAKKGETFAGRDYPTIIGLPSPINVDDVTIENPMTSGILVIEDMTLIGNNEYAPAHHPGKPAHGAARSFPRRHNAPPGYTEYIARFKFSHRAKPKYIEIADTSGEARLAVSYISLFDSIEKISYPVTLLNSLLSASSRFRYVEAHDNLVVLENSRALPRAWLAERAGVMPFDTQKRVIQSGLFPDGETFDPLTTVLLETPPSFDNAISSIPAAIDRVEVTSYSSDDVRIEAWCVSPRFLVLSDVYYPGWSAIVDGRPATLMPADAMIRAIPLAPGLHKVRMKFTPPGFRTGSILSIIAIFYCLVMVIIGNISHRRKQKKMLNLTQYSKP